MDLTIMNVMHRFLKLLVLLLIVCSCEPDKKRFDTYTGIAIVNDGPSGSLYKDSTGKVFAYRSFYITIINDTLVPVQLQMAFTSEQVPLSNSYRSLRVFLLPDSLTRTLQYTTEGNMTASLETFLDKNLNTPRLLKRIIASKNSCNLNVGMLYYPADAGCHAGLFINGDQHSLPIPVKTPDLPATNNSEAALVFGVQVASSDTYALIDCGKLVFTKDK